MHRVLPSTTSYYKACTKYFVLLLRTTKLAQVLPSTTLHYKACTKCFQVLLRTTKLAHKLPSTTSYCLHKRLPSTTLYYKACTKFFPVLLRTTNLAQNTSQYYFVLQTLHKVLALLGTGKRFYTKKRLHTEALHTAKLLHSKAFTHRSFCTQKLLHRKAFRHKGFYTESFPHRSFCTEAFAHTRFYTEKAFSQRKLSHTKACKHRNFRTVRTNFYTKSFAQKLRLQNQISTPKQKEAILKHFLKGLLKGNHKRQIGKNPVTNHYRSLDAAIPIRFTMSSCKRQKYYARSRGAKQP